MINFSGKGQWKGVAGNISRHLDPWIGDGTVTLPADVTVRNKTQEVVWRAHIDIGENVTTLQPQQYLNAGDFPVTVTITDAKQETREFRIY